MAQTPFFVVCPYDSIGLKIGLAMSRIRAIRGIFRMVKVYSYPMYIFGKCA